jgi:sulfate transport system permease protein
VADPGTPLPVLEHPDGEARGGDPRESLRAAPTTRMGRVSATRRRTGPVGLALRILVILYLAILVLVPLALVAWRAFAPGLGEFLAAIADPLALHAFALTGEIAAISVAANTVFGVGVALLLVRYRFPGRRILSALIGLPVAVSPIVVGLALILVYGSTGWLGAPLASAGIQIIMSVPGMVLATIFVSLPLVARAVVPVLEQIGVEQEQAAASLGARAWTRFWRITLPGIRFALVTGVVLSLARCIGEYGAVLVVSGNVQGLTETATLRIDNLFETSLQPDAAYAITFVLIIAAIAAIVVTALLRRNPGETQ